MNIYINVRQDGSPRATYWTEEQAIEDRVKGERQVAIELPPLSDLVLRDDAHRRLDVPDLATSILFLTSEVDELNDAIVHQMADRTRNHEHERDPEAEIGDVLMMVTMVALNNGGKDPIECMIARFRSKGFPTSE